MAVQLVAYELRMGWLDAGARPPEPPWDRPWAESAAVERLLEHLERLLGESGFLDEREPGTVLLRLRRLFFRTRLDQVEVNILRGFLSALERRLSTPERRPGQGGPSGSS
jgi:tRNA C32,U32 (ribose-2'-O)-methylase TrmJ